MIRNLLRTALRNFWKHKQFTLINLLGLTLGIGSSLLFVLWVQDELNMDSFHQHNERIFQVMNYTQMGDGKSETGGQVPAAMAQAVRNDYPEVELAVPMTVSTSQLFIRDQASLSESGMYAGSDFFRLFTFPLLAGEKENVLASPSGVAISASLAKKIFGNDSSPTAVLGKSITIEGQEPLIVSGVFADVPANSSLQFEYVLPIASNSSWKPDEWGGFMYHLFIRLAPEVDMPAFRQKFGTTVARYNETVLREYPGMTLTQLLHPMTDRYLYSKFENGVATGGPIEYVRIFCVVAFIVLVLACINFINLTTAKSETRAKEIGVRKVNGAQHITLALQFFGEALLLTVLATALALVLSWALLPFFNTLTGKEISLLNIFPSFWGILFIIVLLTSLLAGLYPSLFLASLDVVSVFKGSKSFGKRGSVTRQALTVFQFTLSVLIVTATLVIRVQTNYLQSRNLGQAKEQLISFSLRGISSKQYKTLRNELTGKAGISDVTLMNQRPYHVTNNTVNVSWNGDKSSVRFHTHSTDEQYLGTMGISLLEGRNFSTDIQEDKNNFLINEAAARVIGLENPIGTQLELNNQEGQIIGVVQDYHYRSLHHAIDPLIIRNQPTWAQLAIVKFSTGQTQEVLESLQQTLKRFKPNYPFDYTFLDEAYAQLYQTEKRTGQLADLFAVLGIIIAVLGLIGLASFNATQRTKEVGIRKVLGASVRSILILLSKNYLRLILIALLIAIPLANYFIQEWLAGYAFQITIQWWMFAVPAGIITLIALFTISGQTIKAATRNPVDSLRDE
ncbi:MAG: ABC transporter permease [Bacteroidota bacterium]